MTSKQKQNKTNEQQAKRRKTWRFAVRRPWLYGIGAAVGVLILVIGMAPYVIANTPLRNDLLNWLLTDDRMTIEVDSASFGWFTPVRLGDLELSDREGQLWLHVDELRFGKSWLALWDDAPDLGRVEAERPRLDVQVNRITPSGVPGTAPPITLDASIDDGDLRVTAEGVPEPVIEFEDVDLEVRIAESTQGRMLQVEPSVLLDHYPLSPEVCDQGLQLIAPLLAKVAQVEGSVTLELEDFRMPLSELDVDQRRRLLDIQGGLRLHDVRTGFGNPVLREVVGNLSNLFGFEVPSEVRLVDDTEVEFNVRRGRVYHSGLYFLLPEATSDLRWKSWGSVGLDQTLDLTIEAPIPAQLLGSSRLAARMTEKYIQLHVGGTFEQPVIRLAEDRNWLNELAKATLSGEDGEQPVSESAIDTFVDKAAAVIETGQLAYELWNYVADWWNQEAVEPAETSESKPAAQTDGSEDSDTRAADRP